MVFDMLPELTYPSSSKSQHTLVEHVAVNETADLFTAVLELGTVVHVYTVDPLLRVRQVRLESGGNGRSSPSSTISRTSQDELITRAYPLGRTNLLSLVTRCLTGPTVYWVKCVDMATPNNSVIAQYGPFRDVIHSLVVRRDRLVVVMSTQVRLFRFPPASQQEKEDGKHNLSVANVRCSGSVTHGGVGPLVAYGHNDLIAVSAAQRGVVQLVDLSEQFTSPGSRTSIAPVTVTAHHTALTSLAMNLSGSLLATASTTGTIIRVYRTTTMVATTKPESDGESGGGSASGFAITKRLEPKLMAQLRRGSDQAVIHSIAFSPDSRFVLVCSDKTTVHLWALQDEEDQQQQSSSSSSLPSLGSLASALTGLSLDASRSVAQFRLHQANDSSSAIASNASAMVCALGEPSAEDSMRSVVVLGDCGTIHYYRYRRHRNGRTTDRRSEHYQPIVADSYLDVGED